ncbi:hypothetical protein AALP_AA8G027900 [Arabis alpina]|uniref:Uncharacterized protein n=1 Tax=Arabis alpina TaxID=50452 RepID=A0A087G4K8_ARAAL|nr:hypothetical protein AALP_AA8G027900 [Arabis alpina]
MVTPKRCFLYASYVNLRSPPVFFRGHFHHIQKF